MIEGLSIFAETPLRVDCAWCGASISAGREPVSHGICPGCAVRVLQEELGMTEGEARLAIAIEEEAR